MAWKFIYALLIAVGVAVFGMTANDLMHGFVTLPSRRSGDVNVTAANLDIFVAVIALWVVVGCVFIFAGVYGFYSERKHPPR